MTFYCTLRKFEEDVFNTWTLANASLSKIARTLKEYFQNIFISFVSVHNFH